MKDILPRHLYFLSLGCLVSCVASRLNGEIEALDDISVSESNRLSEILGQFMAIEECFVYLSNVGVSGKVVEEEQKVSAISNLREENQVENQVHEERQMIWHYAGKEYKKLSVIRNILTWGFAEIMEAFENGGLECLDSDTLCHFIKALFSESALRATNLNRVRRRNS